MLLKIHNRVRTQNTSCRKSLSSNFLNLFFSRLKSLKHASKILGHKHFLLGSKSCLVSKQILFNYLRPKEHCQILLGNRESIRFLAIYHIFCLKRKAKLSRRIFLQWFLIRQTQQRVVGAPVTHSWQLLLWIIHFQTVKP